MTTRLEEQLHALGSEPVPPARPEFVADLEDRLRGLATPDSAPSGRRARVPWVTAAVAAGLLALLGVALFASPGDREVRTLSPASSSTAQPASDDTTAPDTPTAKPHQRHGAPTSKEAGPERGAPSQQPSEPAPSEPATLRAAAFQHHTRVMIVWDRYEDADFAFYEVRRTDDQRPGPTVIARIRDAGQNGTADQLHDPNMAVRYQVAVVSRDGREVAVSDWLTPEQRERQASEPRPIVTIP